MSNLFLVVVVVVPASFFAGDGKTHIGWSHTTQEICVDILKTLFIIFCIQVVQFIVLVVVVVAELVVF